MNTTEHAARATAPATLNLHHHLLAAAIVLALSPWPRQAIAQTTHAAPAQSAPAAKATAPPQARAATDWIEYEDTTYTPVVDDVSSDLAAARSAMMAKDKDKAAASLQAAARALQGQADRVGQLERERAAADMKLARDTHARLDALVKKIDASADQVRAGKLVTTAQLDKTIDRAARADLDRRWLVSDVTAWYPVTEEPQRHFSSAAALYAKKDYKAAAAEVRRASAYLRLESARAVGDAKSSLVAADAALDRTAHALETGAASSEKSLDQVFAQAEHALAVAHRAKAAEDWSRKAYDKAGYELKAAAHGLDSAAGWTSAKASAAAAASSADARSIGDKLAGGGVWARQEVAHGFEAVGTALNQLGHAIGVKSKAAPFDTGGSPG